MKPSQFLVFNTKQSGNNNDCIERHISRFLQSPHCTRTVSNTYAEVAWVQSSANHVEHIERLLCATYCVPRSTKGQLSCYVWYRLVDLVVKASASRAEGPGFESRLRRDFFGVESYQWLKNWHSSGYPARRLAL